MRYFRIFLVTAFICSCFMTADAAPRKKRRVSSDSPPVLSSTPKTKEEVSIRVKVFQVLPEEGGMLCSTLDSEIFVAYDQDDVADGDVIKITVKRKGTYSYDTRGGNSRRIGKYEWIPKDGQTQILPQEGKPRRISGTVIEVTDEGVKIFDRKEERGAIIVGHPNEEDLIEDDNVSCVVKRIGSSSFINVSNAYRTNPVYRFVSE